MASASIYRLSACCESCVHTRLDERWEGIAESSVRSYRQSALEDARGSLERNGVDWRWHLGESSGNQRVGRKRHLDECILTNRTQRKLDFRVAARISTLRSSPNTNSLTCLDALPYSRAGDAGSGRWRGA